MERRLGGAVCAVAMFAIVGASVARTHGAGIAASATAGYQVTFGGEERTIEFTAQRDTANNSRGEGHLFNHVSGTKIHFTIDCLSVVGSQATISGAVSDSDNAAVPVGTPIWLSAVDNGEGSKSPRDLVSPLFAIFGPEVPCTTSLAPANLPIQGGNIQVH